jgi:integrase
VSVHEIKRGRRKVFKVRYRDDAGDDRSETYDLRADADKRDAEIRQTRQNGEPIPQRGRGKSGQTFERFAMDVWWPQEAAHKAAKTREGYGTLLDLHLVPRIGSMPLALIDTARVLDLRAKLKADGVPDYTSARALKLFRQILGHAVVTGALKANPADVLRGRGQLPPQGRQTDVRPIAPEATEAIRTKMLARRTPHKLRDATLVSVMAYAGLRPQEALALKWENVGKTTVRVERANRDGVLSPTKTFRRSVPLIAPLASDLAQWKAASASAKPDALVFPRDQDDGPWRKEDFANWRRRTFKPSAPAGATPYGLRHGYASLQVRAGVDPATIARHLGHSLVMLMQTYAHVIDEYDGQPPRPMADLVTAARGGHIQATVNRRRTNTDGTRRKRKTRALAGKTVVSASRSQTPVSG